MSLHGILIWCGALIIASSAIQALGGQISDASLWSRDGGKVRQTRGAKRPSCIISIPEDEADGLTKLLNGVLNVFTERPQPAVVNTSSNAGPAFVLNCDNGISELEISVWRILNRVWLATSCQYSEEEFDQALLEVEREADKVLITLRNVDVVPFKGRIKTDYYHNTGSQVMEALTQAVEKMKRAQNTGRCHSSAVKHLTANFEEALREIKSQKETIAVLEEKTRQALAAVMLQNEAMKKALDETRTLTEETESALHRIESQKEAMEGALEMMRSQIGRTDNALTQVAAQNISTAKALQAVESQRRQVEELRSVFQDSTSKTNEKLSAVDSTGWRFSRAIEELREQNTVVQKTLVTQGSEFAEYKGNMSQALESQKNDVEDLRSVFDNQTSKTEEALSAVESAGRSLRKQVAELTMNNTALQDTLVMRGSEFAESQRKQVEDLRSVFDNQRSKTNDAFCAVESASRRFTKDIVELRMKNRAVEETLAIRKSELVEYKTRMNQVVTNQAKKDSQQDRLLEEMNVKLFPNTAIQAYIFWGLRGLTGEPLNIENEYYKGEFLYLARNPTGTTATVWNDGATLAVGVGGGELLQKEFQWELYQAPSEGSSIFYLRNKLNEFKPIPSKQDSRGRRNYIRIEAVSSPTDGDPSQLVITMKEIIDGWYYYPRSTPNTDSELSGRAMHWNSSPSTPGINWILTFASEKLTSTTVPPREFNSTVAPLPEETSTVVPLPEDTSTVATPTAFQIYLIAGLAGLTGKPLNIENEHYKGEFLYLARNPIDRNASVMHDGATLAVGEDKLRESAFQWEFVRVTGEDSSVFYVRNKLNELKPMASKDDDYGSYNYIRIETLSCGTGREPFQLVITIMEMVENDHYFHPNSKPNTDSAINGRDIELDDDPHSPGTKWIVTLSY